MNKPAIRNMHHLDLGSELSAVVAGLARAREAFDGDELLTLDQLWPRLEQCAARVTVLDQSERKRLRPLLLSLLDELEQTIDKANVERQELRDKLRSASLSLAAGVAYGQLGER